MIKVDASLRIEVCRSFEGRSSQYCSLLLRPEAMYRNATVVSSTASTFFREYLLFRACESSDKNGD